MTTGTELLESHLKTLKQGQEELGLGLLSPREGSVPGRLVPVGRPGENVALEPQKRMWSHRNSHSLRMGTHRGTATFVDSLTFSDKVRISGDFPGGPVAKALPSQRGGLGSIPA